MNLIKIKGNLFMFKQRLLYSNLAIILTIVFFISGVIFGEVLYIDSLAYTCLILTVICSFIYGISMYVTDGQKTNEVDENINVIDDMITSIDNMISNINEITETAKEKITSNTNYVLKKQVKKKHHNIKHYRGYYSHSEYYKYKKFKNR